MGHFLHSWIPKIDSQLFSDQSSSFVYLRYAALFSLYTFRTYIGHLIQIKKLNFYAPPIPVSSIPIRPEIKRDFTEDSVLPKDIKDYFDPFPILLPTTLIHIVSILTSAQMDP